MSPTVSPSPRPLSASLLVTDLSVNPAGPDRASVTWKATVTSTSLWFAGFRIFGLAVHVTTGAVLSILTVTTLLRALTLPAASVTVLAVDDTAVPSPLRTWSAGQAPAGMPS